MAKMVKTKTGKVKYASRVASLKRRSEQRKEPDGSFWADFSSRRDFGTFSHEHRTYRHNGKDKQCM